MERYIPIKVVIDRDNNIIPIWDTTLKFQKDLNIGNYIKTSDSYLDKVFDLKDAIFDLETKKISLGEEINIYPEKMHIEHKVGDEVLFEVSNRCLQLTKVADIIYEDFELTIKKGKKLESYEINQIKQNSDIKVTVDGLYSIKRWKPTWVLANGEKTEWSFKLFKMKK